MIFNLRQPKSFCEIGRKDNQEDFLWPNPDNADSAQRIFIMCDGVGGQEKGEVASSTAGTAIGEYITKHWPKSGIVTKDDFNAALAYAYDQLDKADEGSTSSRKMGTTMTCLVLHRRGALLAHIGDSRIYHLRPAMADEAHGHNGIIYQTEDHSLVNDLLKVGEITEEEAEHFPHKNIITRAMQPQLERRYIADIYNITDVKAGDYFFLCSDGVLEQVSNARLAAIVADESLDDDAKIAAIHKTCFGNTRDNFTCWLVPVDSVEIEDEQTLAIAEAEAAESTIPVETSFQPDPNNDAEEEDEDTVPFAADETNDGAEEDDEDEDTVEADADESDEDEEEPQSWWRRAWASIAKACKATSAFVAPRWKKFTAFIRRTWIYRKLQQTSRWQWIITTILVLGVYDFTLYFFGDTSYNIIFPKAEPNDSIDYEPDQPKLIEREVDEEYVAPKPAEVIKEEKKAERRESGEVKETTHSTHDEIDVVSEEMLPTAVTPEAIEPEDHPSSNDIKVPKIKLPPMAPGDDKPSTSTGNDQPAGGEE